MLEREQQYKIGCFNITDKAGLHIERVEKVIELDKFVTLEVKKLEALAKQNKEQNENYVVASKLDDDTLLVIALNKQDIDICLYDAKSAHFSKEISVEQIDKLEKAFERLRESFSVTVKYINVGKKPIYVVNEQVKYFDSYHPKNNPVRAGPSHTL